MPPPDESEGIQLNVAAMKEMIRQVVFAASSDEARPVLTGVLLTVEEDKITLVSADGFRLSVRSATLSLPVNQPAVS